MSVVVTAASTVTAGLHEREQLWCSVCRDELLPATTLSAEQLCQLAGLSQAEAAILSRQQQLGLAAAELAWTDARLPAERQPLRGEQKDGLDAPWRLKAGVVAASALGDLSSLLLESNQPGFRARPTSLSRWRGNALGEGLKASRGQGPNRKARSHGLRPIPATRNHRCSRIFAVNQRVLSMPPPADH
jgi:hypothetical protein